MVSLRLILLILALVAFIGAAVNVQTRINLTGLGLALWVLSLLIT
jgi:hypothetical protein